MDAMMANVINGVNAMPAKGMCFDCTDADLRALVDWMIESSK
jgi:cytochrome c5